VKENARIRHVIRERRPLHVTPGIRSEELVVLLEKMRGEGDAVLVIQKTWKRYLINKWWRERATSVKLVKHIQRVARGYIVRRLVAEWFHARNRMVVQWQARIRKYLDLQASVHYIAFRRACITLHYITFHHITFHGINHASASTSTSGRPCITLHRIALRCITLHEVRIHKCLDLRASEEPRVSEMIRRRRVCWVGPALSSRRSASFSMVR
jgi:hypothetical protein